MKMKCTTFLIICLWSFSIAWGNSTIQFENIGVAEGLPSPGVAQIIQDDLGFLWVATTNGLARYDGLDFKTFTHNEEDPLSISDNNIRCLHKDSNGDIWVGTLNKGLNRYNYKTGTFTKYLMDEDANSISSNDILTIYEDTQKRIWIGTENGLNLYDSVTDSFIQFHKNTEDKTALQGNAILTILEDYRGWIWLGTWDGGIHLMIPADSPEEITFRHFKIEHTQNTLKSNNIWKIFQDNEKRIWLGTYGGGLSVMNESTEIDILKFSPTFTTFKDNTSLPKKAVTSNVLFGLNQDRDGKLWISTVNGLTVAEPYTELVDGKIQYGLKDPHHYLSSKNSNKGLINNEMREIFVDKRGIVWCATLGGISKYDKNSSQFFHHLQYDNNESKYEVIALYEYDENITYVGSRYERGLIEYNKETKEIKSYYNPAYYKYPDLFTEFISFYSPHPDTLWAGTRTGISYFNPKTKLFKDYRLTHPSGKATTNLHVRKIIQDRNKKYWLGTGYGLVTFNDKTGKFTFIEKDKNNINLPNTDINDLAFDEDGSLWIATFGGLIKIEFDEDGSYVFKKYSNDAEDPKSICSNRVLSLIIHEGILWAGTENGLARFNEADDNFENITSTLGLKDPGVLAIHIGNDNNLWYSTRNGLVCLEPSTMHFSQFDEKDGIKTGAFLLYSSFKNKKGELLFGGINGFIKLNSKKIKTNQYLPPVYISDITIFGLEKYWEKSIPLLDKIVLQPNENYFTVSFTTLNLSQSSDNQYAYKLDGFHDDWVYCGKQKQVSFSNLKGGTYTFRVKASNNDGYWNEEGKSLTIQVVPKLINRVWFRLLILITVLTAIYSFYVYRVNRIQKQKERLEQQVEERTQEIQFQKSKIERLNEELRRQNTELEDIVMERTKNLEKSNMELKQSNRDLEQFAYIASHDLQEPLRTIGSFTQIISKKYKNNIDESGHELMSYITDGVKRMSTLIHSLLDYSKLGSATTSFERTHIKTIIELKLLDLSLKIKEKNAKVIINDIPETIYCSIDQIGIVFYNLINNAIKFNESDQPTITLNCKSNDDYYIFSVKDNGIGIKEKNNTVFELFQRADVKKKYEGNGIGLSLCRRVIERHEGDIWYESVYGEGTTFFFTVSKHLDAPNAQQDAEAQH